jgi:hypothetical protein
MPFTLRCPLAPGLAAGCLAALTVSLLADGAPAPNELQALFARYDRESDGQAREALAAQIDAVAHQKYATVSRLYWHTDLASAKVAARVHGRPILHLRMLGRLDEDLSCANSRLFRATLYANQDVSAFLRERFILYWSSERPVPRVTIEYGDGRTLERTTTGNSAHYVLDEHGNVIDVLPGLYAPAAFRRELEGALALAALVRGTSDDDRAKRLVEYHEQHVNAARRDWQRLAGTPWIPGARQLLTQARVEGELAAAQLRTFSKAAMELNDLRSVAKGLAPESLSDDQVEIWSAIGQRLYGIGDLKSAARPQGVVIRLRRELTVERPQLPPPPRVMDEASRALVARLHDAVPDELRATDHQRNAMIARLEQTIVADTALNQLRLRPLIGGEIVRQGGRVDFATLNAWIYAEVFRTPKQDAWLGLLPRNVFTGLPGDGVVMR